MNEQYQHRARKRFGQNFLHDAGIIDRILRAIHAKAGEHLLEIGPGQGALTEGLLGSGAQLDVVELIFHLLSHAGLIRDMHFMLQKEVVERMAAGPGGGDWGRLSIMVQYHCRVEHLFNVGPGAFNPPPKVDSAIVRLVPHEVLPFPAKDHLLLERVVREAFNQRRKTLRNTLKGLLDSQSIEAAGVDGSLRPEQLDLAAFVRLADQLADQQA